MKAGLRIVDADGHVLDREADYRQYLEPAYRDVQRIYPMDGFDRFDGALGRRRAYHWDNSNIDDEGEDLLFSHLKTGFRISDFGSVNSNPQCYQSTTEPSSAS